jgi:hypothetical protein
MMPQISAFAAERRVKYACSFAKGIPTPPAPLQLASSIRRSYIPLETRSEQS